MNPDDKYLFHVKKNSVSVNLTTFIDLLIDFSPFAVFTYAREGRYVLAAHAWTNANGQPWTGACSRIGSPSYQIYLFHDARVFCVRFLCAFLWNKRGYVPCPYSTFYSSTSGVKTFYLWCIDPLHIRLRKWFTNAQLSNCSSSNDSSLFQCLVVLSWS